METKSETLLKKISGDIKKMEAAPAREIDIVSEVETLCNYNLENIVSLSRVLSGDLFNIIDDPNKIYCLNCLLNEKIEEFASELQKLLQPASSEAAGATI